MSASLLPNGEQYFPDINGKPLVGGTVGMYIPGTLVPKDTWQNSAQTVLNTNPIILDSRGLAIIYGAGTYRQIVKDEAGNLIWDQLTSNFSAAYLTPEMFGAVGNGVADDTAAIQDAINAALATGPKVIIGTGNYGLSGQVDISNFSAGLSLSLNTLTAITAFPSPANWKTATSMIRVGFTGGSQVGLEVNVLYVDGGGKADIIHIQNNGCGGSNFHLGFTSNTNINVKISSLTSQAASNYFTGNYWMNGKQAANITGSGSGNPEGTTFDVGFITAFLYGGIVLNDGARYTNVRGQLDFSGTWLTQVAVASISGWAIGDTFTDTTVSKTGEVLAVYTFESVPTILVIEIKSTTGGSSNFANGNSVTNGTATTTISSVTTTNQSSNNIYYDIVQAYPATEGFARNTIITPYLGGIIGSFLFTNFLQSANSNSSITNSNQGFMITNNGAGQIDFYNTFLSQTTPFLDVTATLFSPKGTVFLSSTGGVYGINVGVSLPTGVSTPVLTFPTGGTNGAVWFVNAINPSNSAVSSFGIFYVANGASSGRYISLDTSNVTLSVTGLILSAVQGTGSTQALVVTVTRNSGP